MLCYAMVCYGMLCYAMVMLCYGDNTMLCYGDGSDIKLPLDRHENPTYKLFYMHPEMCVYDKKIQAFFNCIL